MITRPAASTAVQSPCSAISTPRSARNIGAACQATSASRQAREAQPLQLRRVVEQWSDPVVQQVAMLAEAMLAAARVARRFDERVELCGFARPAANRAAPREGRKPKRSARSAQVSSTICCKQHGGDRRACQARSGNGRFAMAASLGHAPEVRRPLGLHSVVMRRREREIGGDHVHLGERRATSRRPCRKACRVRPCRAPLPSGRGEASRGPSARRIVRARRGARRAEARCCARSCRCRPRSAPGCRRQGRRRCRSRRERRRRRRGPSSALRRPR